MIMVMMTVMIAIMVTIVIIIISKLVDFSDCTRVQNKKRSAFLSCFHRFLLIFSSISSCRIKIRNPEFSCLYIFVSLSMQSRLRVQLSMPLRRAFEG